MWARNFFCKFTENSLTYSFAIALAVFSVYVLISSEVRFLHLTFHNLLSISALSLLIGYQFIIIVYLFSGVEGTFDRIIPLFKEGDFTAFQSHLKTWLGDASVLNRTILLVVIPFMALEIIRFWQWRYSGGEIPLYFSLFDPGSNLALLLDVLNHILAYLMYIMLAIIVWFLIGLTDTIASLGKKNSILTDVFHSDGMGGLKPVQHFMLMAVSNYFIIIALAMIAFVSPRSVVSYETIFLLILLLLGIRLFLITMSTTRSLINKGVGTELDRIDDMYRINYEKLLELASGKEHEREEEELEKLQLILDLLEKEEKKIRDVHDKNSSKRAIYAFTGSFLVPSITLLEDLTGTTVSDLLEKVLGYIGTRM